MPIPDNPNIKIALTGLVAFCFDDGRKNCQVGILRGIKAHKLRFKVFKVNPDSRQEFDFSDKANTMEVFLKVSKTDNEGVQLYTNGPFSRDESDDPNDFRWVTDIEGQEFHDQPLAVAPGKLTPSFHFNNGLFYTALKTPADIMQNSIIKVPDTSVAVFMGVNIYLADSDEASLVFGDEIFPLKKEANTTYKLQVFNDCPGVAPSSAGDFLFYYRAFKKQTLEDIPDDEQFSVLAPPVPGGTVDPENRQHPCGPAFGGKIKSF
jgi:hypothetical protein